eukprot:260_1
MKIREVISMIKIQHPLLFTDFNMQIKFIEKLGLGLEVLDDNSKTEYLMHRLLTYSSQINEKHPLFICTKYTITKNVISKIRNHSLLLKSSQHKEHIPDKNMTILERFIYELQIDELLPLYLKHVSWFCNHLYINQKGNVTLNSIN